MKPLVRFGEYSADVVRQQASTFGKKMKNKLNALHWTAVLRLLRRRSGTGTNLSRRVKPKKNPQPSATGPWVLGRCSWSSLFAKWTLACFSRFG